MKAEIDYYSPEYKRSRAAYVAQSTFEYLVALLATGAFLAKLLTSLGISDALAGIIASFSSLVFVVQLFSLVLVKGRLGAKALSMIFETASQLCFALMYFVPFMPFGRGGRQAVVIGAVLVAYICKYLVYSILFGWGNSFFDPKKRGAFSARREIISLITGIVFSLTVSYVFDSLEAAGNLRGSFLLVGGLMFACGIVNFICMMVMRPLPKWEESEQKKPLSEVLRQTVGKSPFRRVLFFSVIFSCAGSFTLGFLGVYKTNDLLMTLFLVELINMASNLCRLFVTAPFGRYADRTSFAKGLRLGAILLAIAFFFCMITTPRTWFFIILFSILYNMSLAGTNQNSFNIMYTYIDSQYITQAMAIKSCVGGICGFLAALVGGWILSAVQKNGNRVLGLQIYGQQLLAAISLVLAIVAILYLHFAIVRHDTHHREGKL